MITQYIRSMARGRTRVRHPAFRNAETAEQVRALLAGIEGMTAVTVNPRVGSMLLTWDPDKLTAEKILDAVKPFEGLIDEAAKAAPAEKPLLALPWISKRDRRICQNRAMLGSLVLSLAALAVRGSSLHVAVGSAFITALALHLYQHRRVL